MASKRKGLPIMPNLLRKDLDYAHATFGISKVHEASVARTFGGRITVGSGNKEDKGDVKVKSGAHDILFECKATNGATMRIKAAWLVKITEEAGFNRIPALCVKFMGYVLDNISMAKYHRRVKVEEEWVAVPKSVFDRLLRESSEE